MIRYIALLRAINVGGHTIKMADLKNYFEALGFENVSTFIASGNVLFDTPSSSEKKLESVIEARLKQKLGYEVATFVRTLRAVADIAAHPAFSKSAIAKATAYNVAFLKEPLGVAQQKKLTALKNSIDDFHVHGREVYWLCRKKQSESKFSNAVLEKTLGTPATLRGMNTVQKIAAMNEE